ncbi:glycosyltransferase family 2 protein [Dysgonomonas sp. 521]|uniref:glycosyltransferase family 2 protein n=1 Tax=Dysgonomonas sp. 521 TaxID=2302932 RepID=UPI0013D4689B|nr:glycosyltransferase family 2 protein [Dysgonomonas sp. 521]NDV96122.1 glycosyltransferase family 2 protein [Dysgonomonas sp. 521]
MYKVTIAIPVYNVEKYMKRALLSALNQTFESIEFLLIDDRGSDNSMAIAMEVAKNHPRGNDVRVIDHGVNIGLGAVRNTAIENAKGEYLYFLDSDDDITPDCISILYNRMMEYPVDFVAASHNIIASNGLLKEQKLYEDSIVRKGDFAVANAYYKGTILLTTYTVNKLYNLKFLRNNNIRCIHLMYEDIFFTYNLILHAQSCQIVSDATYNYYEHATSIMAKTRKSFSSERAKQFNDIISLKKEYSHKYINYNFYPNLIRRIYIRYALPFSIKIYYSNLIEAKEANAGITNILRYPLNFKKMIALKRGSHWIFYFLDKIPFLYAKIFACRLFLRFTPNKLKQ